ncbi:hypothetical protein KI387_040240 [Taxus chinensis]|uniref:Uncharacterized protein n=1 Tax=Taxus chinensis TaxID=29808 RepID=A0AA38C614_TAXCH|nr:hypothetical protein KI387_040240 [Taxus chinensis]
MDTLVLPAQDQFSHAQSQRLAGVEYYPQKKYEMQWQTPTVGASMHQERITKTHGSESGVSSHPEKLLEHDNSCSFSSVLSNEKSSTHPEKLLEHENNCSFSSVLPNEKSSSPASVPILPSCMLSATFHEGYASNTAREEMAQKMEEIQDQISKTKTPCHSAMNKKRSGCDWKPVETGPQNCRAVTIPKQSYPERKSPILGCEMNVSNGVSSISPPASPTENWAGPAYSNSPPPSSLPLPKFSMRQMRSASLELPSASGEFSEALSTEALRASSWSVPTSPSRENTDCSCSRFCDRCCICHQEFKADPAPGSR